MVNFTRSSFSIINLTFKNSSLINSLLCKIDLLPATRSFSISTDRLSKFNTPERFLRYNDKVFPPQELGEERRPAFICHQRTHIKYSPKKMWYIAAMVRGLPVDEAINQLKFVNKKGAIVARETIEEAKALAVDEHNVEYGSNLWVSESFVGKSLILKGARRHAKGRFGVIHYRYCHYFVTLEEGTPPEHYYYHNRPLSAQEKLDNWIKGNRERKIPFSL